MIDVVGDGDVLAEDLFAEAAGKAGALVGDRGGGKIVKEKTDEIEDGGGLQDDGVAAGGEFDGVLGASGFFAGNFCQRFADRRRGRLAAFALAQLAADPCCIVTENSAWVWR